MKKIIRLTESDLTNIVKRVLSEQETKKVISEQVAQTWDPQVKEMGETIANKLKGQAFCAEDESEKYNYRCHRITGYEYTLNVNRVTSPYLIPEFNLQLKVESVDDSNKLSKGNVSFNLNLNKGYPVGFDTFFVHYGDNMKMLKDGEYKKSLLSKIKNIRITKPTNPCFEGWKHYHPKTSSEFSSMEDLKVGLERFEKYDPKKNEIRLYKDMGDWSKGTGQIIPNNIEFGGKISTINWSCSNGKLTITPVSNTTTTTTTPVKTTTESLDFKCLVNAGFTKNSTGGGATKATVYEKRIGNINYQFATKINQVIYYDVYDGKMREKVGKWKCDSASTSPIKGVKIYDVTERRRMPN